MATAVDVAAEALAQHRAYGDQDDGGQAKAVVAALAAAGQLDQEATDPMCLPCLAASALHTCGPDDDPNRLPTPPPAATLIARISDVSGDYLTEDSTVDVDGQLVRIAPHSLRGGRFSKARIDEALAQVGWERAGSPFPVGPETWGVPVRPAATRRG